MYDVFDEFLTTQTWHTMSHSDGDRFFCALRSVVEDPEFRPERMRQYMLRRAPEHEEAIDDYVKLAVAVVGYVRAQC
jgi:hypothetical protein